MNIVDFFCIEICHRKIILAADCLVVDPQRINIMNTKSMFITHSLKMLE